MADAVKHNRTGKIVSFSITHLPHIATYAGNTASYVTDD